MQRMGEGAQWASAYWGPGGLPVCRNGGGGPVGIAKLGSGGVPVLPKSVCRKVAEILPRLGFTKVCVGRLRNSRPAAQMGDWGWPAEWGKRPAAQMGHWGWPAKWGKGPSWHPPTGVRGGLRAFSAEGGEGGCGFAKGAARKTGPQNPRKRRLRRAWIVLNRRTVLEPP